MSECKIQIVCARRVQQMTMGQGAMISSSSNSPRRLHDGYEMLLSRLKRC